MPTTSRTFDATAGRELAGALERGFLGEAEAHAARILFVHAPQVNDGAARARCVSPFAVRRRH
jgi:hypothetical protein